jgi:hypothetical protein
LQEVRALRAGAVIELDPHRPRPSVEP